jgi:hypothetical protein
VITPVAAIGEGPSDLDGDAVKAGCLAIVKDRYGACRDLTPLRQLRPAAKPIGFASVPLASTLHRAAATAETVDKVRCRSLPFPNII